jgi:hypothetical protein
MAENNFDQSKRQKISRKVKLPPLSSLNRWYLVTLSGDTLTLGGGSFVTHMIAI